jgi:YfiH family protein|tara:strand:- start:471 stop:1199 length:729 start_codon:yes stop_codon:yes gene_type:complete
MAKIEIKKIGWDVPKNIKAFITTRIGGASRNKYKFANLSLDVGDSKSAVMSNREEVQRTLNLPSEPSWMKQIHGTNIQYLKSPKKNIMCDGSYTDQPGIVCCVLSADCLPIMMCDRFGRKVGVIHVGWRGLDKDLIPKFIKKLKINSEDLCVWIGPSISANNYLVREDVYSKLKRISTKIFKKIDSIHWSLNLAMAAKIILKKERVNNIFEDKTCTFESSNLYYSFRRDNVTGRMASLIWRE